MRNDYISNGDTTLILLSNTMKATIDTGDLPVVSSIPGTWTATQINNVWYAVTTIKSKPLYMHRLVMGNPTGMVVDHQDHNGLNNCRYNLCASTIQENSFNRSSAQSNSKTGVRGVSYDLRHNIYDAKVTYKGTKYRAKFKCLLEATMYVVAIRNQLDNKKVIRHSI